MSDILSTLPQPWSMIFFIISIVFAVLKIFLWYKDEEKNYKSDKSVVNAGRLAILANGIGFMGSISLVCIIALILQPKYGESIWFYVFFIIGGSIVVLLSTYYFWFKHKDARDIYVKEHHKLK
jgi:NhaP-type Na+/H+ or K+/H+ antiporter